MKKKEVFMRKTVAVIIALLPMILYGYSFGKKSTITLKDKSLISKSKKMNSILISPTVIKKQSDNSRNQSEFLKYFDFGNTAILFGVMIRCLKRFDSPLHSILVLLIPLCLLITSTMAFHPYPIRFSFAMTIPEYQFPVQG
ncbi:MAG: hypothetical protein GWP03_03110 [Proteobacteria bacterium]|nr:hypothetical protein [Pseudomonadota bacterium]